MALPEDILPLDGSQAPVDPTAIPATSPLLEDGGQSVPEDITPDTILEEPTVEEFEALELMQAQDNALLTPEEMAALGMGDEILKEDVDPNVKHYANLAKDIDDNELGTMAVELINLVESDENSREDWFERVKRGIRNLGVSSKTFGGANFEGASKVVHPVLMEACTQFQARAIQEMWPSQGPVQTQVLGEKTPEREDQAERVMNYMNYLYTVRMSEAFEQEDNMLLRLPISGSTFKKMYYDPLKKRLASIFVEPADFIISYQTVDIKSSPRFTHRIREYMNDVRKKEATGFYVKGKKQQHDTRHSEDTDKPQILDEIDLTEGKERTTYYDEDEDEDRATMYEIYIDYDVDGLLSDDETDEDDVILKPYIITVDRDLQIVKRIQRNWKPDDELETKRMYFTHYKFTPGLGFYGYGFLHLIGDMAATATGALRSLLDSAAFSNLQGGFRTRHSRTPGGDKPISPGEWREVDSTAEELKDAFFNIPYKEPSATLFNLLGYVDDKARHLAGITETVTGEASAKNAPVGTTAMLLEQGTKVFTSIHKRIHESHKQEFKIMAELIEEYMPDEGYPYLLPNAEGQLLPEDFDERIDVIPVSDPNVSSNAQRVAKAQSILELQQTYPEIIGEREAVKRMLEAIQVQNIDALIGSDEEQAQKDQAAAEKQAEMEALEAQRIAIETEKLQSEVLDIKASAVQSNLEAMKASFEAASLAATSTELVPMADSLMGSAGFDDADGDGIMPTLEQPVLGQPGQPGQPVPGQPPMPGQPGQPVPGEALGQEAPMQSPYPMEQSGPPSQVGPDGMVPPPLPEEVPPQGQGLPLEGVA